MAAQILKRERAKEFLLKSHSKKLEATSFNNINWIGFYRLTFLG